MNDEFAKEYPTNFTWDDAAGDAMSKYIFFIARFRDCKKSNNY